MRALELMSFAALASGLHLGAWLLMSDGGGAAPGGGAGQAMTVAAAPDHFAALAEQWQTPPSAVLDVVQMRAPAPTRNLAMPAPTSPHAPVAVPSHMSAPRADTAPSVVERSVPPIPDSKIAAPSLPQVAPAALPDPSAQTPQAQDTPRRPDQMPAAMQRPNAPQPPQIDSSSDAPKGELRHSKRPKAAPKRPERTPSAAPKRVAEAPTQATKPKGAATGVTARSARSVSSKPASASPGVTTKLTRVWGQAITSKIQANAVRPTAHAGQKANVRLRVTVSKSGKLLSYGIAQSSGLPAFDKASLRAVKRARRFAKAPAGLDKPSYTFAVTVGFR